MKRKIRIYINDLRPWFIEDHGRLPARYLASCEKFFLKKKIAKPQAASKGGPARNVQGHKEKK